MTPAPGELIASGRAADVYALPGDRVLRRYRTEHDVEPEGRLMAWLADQGMPVPAVHLASGRDLVMDRVAGPTMLEDLQQHPWRIVRHARCLAALQRRLAGIPAPEWLEGAPGVPEGTAVLHLDLHPMNVMMAPAGPVLIDWTNAARGAAAFDAATTYAIIASFEAEGARDRIAQQVLTRAFARARGRAELRSALDAACARRLDDPNVTPGEKAVLARLRTRP